jgi:hypothetical protein
MGSGQGEGCPGHEERSEDRSLHFKPYPFRPHFNMEMDSSIAVQLIVYYVIES